MTRAVRALETAVRCAEATGIGAGQFETTPLPFGVARALRMVLNGGACRWDMPGISRMAQVTIGKWGKNLAVRFPNKSPKPSG